MTTDEVPQAGEGAGVAENIQHVILKPQVAQLPGGAGRIDCGLKAFRPGRPSRTEEEVHSHGSLTLDADVKTRIAPELPRSATDSAMEYSLKSAQPVPWRVIVGSAPIDTLMDQINTHHALILLPQVPELVAELTDKLAEYSRHQLWLCPDRLAESKGEGVWHSYNDHRFDGLNTPSDWSTIYPNLRIVREESCKTVSLDKLIQGLANGHPTLKAHVDAGGGQLWLYGRDPAPILKGATEIIEKFAEIRWHPGTRPSALHVEKIKEISELLSATLHQPEEYDEQGDAFDSAIIWSQDQIAYIESQNLHLLNETIHLNSNIKLVIAERDAIAVELEQLRAQQADFLRAQKHQAATTQQQLDAMAAERGELSSQHDQLILKHESLVSECNAMRMELAKLHIQQEEQAELIRAHEHQCATAEQQLESTVSERDELIGERNELIDEHGSLISDRQTLRMELEKSRIQQEGLADRYKAQANKLAMVEQQLKSIVCERDKLLSEQSRLLAERESLMSERNNISASDALQKGMIEIIAAEVVALINMLESRPNQEVSR